MNKPREKLEVENEQDERELNKDRENEKEIGRDTDRGEGHSL